MIWKNQWKILNATSSPHPHSIFGRTSVWTYEYSVLHRFRQAKFACGGLLFNLEPISATAPVTSKMKFALKVVKIDSKNNRFATCGHFHINF